MGNLSGTWTLKLFGVGVCQTISSGVCQTRRLARVKTSGNKKPPTFAEGLSNQTNRTKTFEVFVFYF